jgi:BMFP domain-containing protein YqiC
MLNKNVLDEIGSKVNEILANSPAKDIERNMRTMLTGVFSRLDLVTREEFDVQQEVIKRTRIKLAELEEKVNRLESQLHQSISADSSIDAGNTENK